MTTLGPALIAKATEALLVLDALGYVTYEEAAHAVLNAVADDLRAGALDEAAEAVALECRCTAPGREHGDYGIICCSCDAEDWLREQAAEIRAGAS